MELVPLFSDPITNGYIKHLLIVKHVSPSQEPEPQTQDFEDSTDSKTGIKKPRSISPLVCSYNVERRVKSISMFFVQIFIFLNVLKCLSKSLAEDSLSFSLESKPNCTITEKSDISGELLLNIIF